MDNKKILKETKTHASISKIIESRNIKKITTESLSKCMEEALKKQ